VEDHEPVAVNAPVDPDAGTIDVAEQAGVTGRTLLGEANAFGVHVVNTGGVPRVLDNFDILCTATTNVNDRDQFGRCPADQVITSGNRELLFASSSLQLGSDTGTVASAALEASPPADEATDHDIRSAGRCEGDALRDHGASNSAVPCPNGAGQPLQRAAGGTSGLDGKGYPVPGAQCEDFDGKPNADDATGLPVGRAHAQCDTTAHNAAANATMAALTTDGLPVAVTVAQSSTSVASRLVAGGQESSATATVRGVNIGGVITIAGITATATTIAHGRTDTGHTTVSVAITGVSGPGTSCAVCDPATVVALINRVFGANVRARTIAPRALATPHGYRAVVDKDPALVASDRAVNDDDTVAASALDLVFYNDSAPTNRDGSSGRSRVVLSLAGVQAESRYGIFRLPVAATFDAAAGDAVSPVSVLGTSTAALDDAAPVTPAPASAVAAPQAVAPGAPTSVRHVTSTLAIAAQRPRELVMFAITWMLLLAPLYFLARRRVRARVLAP